MASCRTFSGVTAVIGFVTLVAGVACSTKIDNTYLPVGRFSKAYAQALCGSLHHCCNQNQVAFSDTECTAGWKAVVDKILSDPYLAANYNDQAGTECVNEVIAAAGTTCDPLPGSISAARDACQAVFIGRKLVGELCSSPLECAPVPDNVVTCQGFPLANPNKGLLPLSTSVGANARQPGASELHLATIPSQRTCIAYPSSGSDTSCATADLKAICEQSASNFCDPADFTCKTRGDLGSECTTSLGCKAGLFCTQLACSPGLTAGGACTSTLDCSDFYYCDSASKTCTDKKRPGDACSVDEQCTVGVCDLQSKKCLANGIATTEACNGTDPSTVARQ